MTRIVSRGETASLKTSEATRRLAARNNRLSFVPPAPVFYFGDTEYRVDESDGLVEVKVRRTGTDLSKPGAVTVRSRKTDPVSAEGGYPSSGGGSLSPVPLMNFPKLLFSERTKPLRLSILDLKKRIVWKHYFKHL